MNHLPAFNPFVAGNAVCSQCGTVMEQEILRGPQNRVSGILYRCLNEESGCAYQIESDIRLTGSVMPIPAHDSR